MGGVNGVACRRAGSWRCHFRRHTQTKPQHSRKSHPRKSNGVDKCCGPGIFVTSGKPSKCCPFGFQCALFYIIINCWWNKNYDKGSRDLNHRNYAVLLQLRWINVLTCATQSWIIDKTKNVLTETVITVGSHFVLFSSSEVKSNWLITAEASQSAIGKSASHLCDVYWSLWHFDPEISYRFADIVRLWFKRSKFPKEHPDRFHIASWRPYWWTKTILKVLMQIVPFVLWNQYGLRSLEKKPSVR